MPNERIIKIIGYLWRHILREPLIKLAEKTDNEIDDKVIQIVDVLLDLGGD